MSPVLFHLGKKNHSRRYKRYKKWYSSPFWWDAFLPKLAFTRGVAGIIFVYVVRWMCLPRHTTRGHLPELVVAAPSVSFQGVTEPSDERNYRPLSHVYHCPFSAAEDVPSPWWRPSPVPPDSQTSGAGPGRETRPAACQVLTTAMMVVWHIKIMVELLSLWHHLHWCNQLLCYCGASVTWPPTDDNRSNNKMQLRFNHQAIYFHVCTIRAWAERGIRRSFQPWHGRRRWRWIMMMEVSGILPGETN